MRSWAAKGREHLRHTFFKRGGQGWSGLLIPSDHLFQVARRLWLIHGIEDSFEVSRDLGSH